MYITFTEVMISNFFLKKQSTFITLCKNFFQSLFVFWEIRFQFVFTGCFIIFSNENVFLCQRYFAVSVSKYFYVLSIIWQNRSFLFVKTSINNFHFFQCMNIILAEPKLIVSGGQNVCVWNDQCRLLTQYQRNSLDCKLIIGNFFWKFCGRSLILKTKWFLRYLNGIIQKQLSRGVLRKRCSENMQQIYRRTPMPKCDFNKVAQQLYSNHISAWMFCEFAL